MSEWQPIETAPRDVPFERPVLVYGFGYDLAWREAGGAWKDMTTDYIDLPPTHWAPIPPPPPEPPIG